MLLDSTIRVGTWVRARSPKQQVRYNVLQPKPPSDPTKPDKREIWYDLQKVQKELHEEYDLPYAPPALSLDNTQIVKLKWLPSQKPKGRGEDGIMWRGLLAVDLGVAKANATLQCNVV